MLQVYTVIFPTGIMKIGEQPDDKGIYFRSNQQLTIIVHPVPMDYPVETTVIRVGYYEISYPTYPLIHKA